MDAPPEEDYRGLGSDNEQAILGGLEGGQNTAGGYTDGNGYVDKLREVHLSEHYQVLS